MEGKMKKELFALLTALVMMIFGLAVLEIVTLIDNSDGTITQTRNDGSVLYNADVPMAWWADHYQVTYSTGQQKKSGIYRGKQIQNHDGWIPMKRQKQLVYGDRHSPHGYEVWRDTGLIEPRLWSGGQVSKGM
jgi:hypothetical protein